MTNLTQARPTSPKRPDYDITGNSLSILNIFVGNGTVSRGARSPKESLDWSTIFVELLGGFNLHNADKHSWSGAATNTLMGWPQTRCVRVVEGLGVYNFYWRQTVLGYSTKLLWIAEISFFHPPINLHDFGSALDSLEASNLKVVNRCTQRCLSILRGHSRGTASIIFPLRWGKPAQEDVAEGFQL